MTSLQLPTGELIAPHVVVSATEPATGKPVAERPRLWVKPAAGTAPAVQSYLDVSTNAYVALGGAVGNIEDSPINWGHNILKANWAGATFVVGDYTKALMGAPATYTPLATPPTLTPLANGLRVSLAAQTAHHTSSGGFFS